MSRKRNPMPPPESPSTLLIKRYSLDTVYKFTSTATAARSERATACVSVRGEVSGFSYRSRRRCRLVLRNIAHHMQLTFGLTYPADFPTDGRRVKRNLGALLDWFRRRGLGYFWIIEFQRRGAPHFHGFLTGLVTHDELSSAWNKIISADRLEYFEDSAHLKNGVYLGVIENQDKLASYFTEYMKKLEQKIVPPQYDNVGRYWGFTRRLLQVKVQTVTATHRELSRLLRIERRKYFARCRAWGFKWKWTGYGWTAWDERKEIT